MDLGIRCVEPERLKPAQVTGVFDRLGKAGIAAWSRWQAFLGCLGFAMVPQAFALAAVGPAACGSALAALGAALGTALTAAIRLSKARQPSPRRRTPPHRRPLLSDTQASDRSGIGAWSLSTAPGSVAMTNERKPLQSKARVQLAAVTVSPREYSSKVS